MGQIQEPYSISAGLDYPGVGPEHAYLAETGRVEFTNATDQEALDALIFLSRTEGIIPAIERAHALAEAFKRAKEMDKTLLSKLVIQELKKRQAWRKGH